jgi:hypothetical protein
VANDNEVSSTGNSEDRGETMPETEVSSTNEGEDTDTGEGAGRGIDKKVDSVKYEAGDEILVYCV